MKNTVLGIFALALLGLAPLSVQASASVGDVVTCPDTSAVYYLAEDGGRYVFFNEAVFRSHYANFDRVKEVDCAELSAFALTGNVVHRAGSALIKIQSDPTVFAVEPNGLLREIASEQQARALFGDEWSGLVEDVAPTLFPSFEIGSPLAEGELPEGMILEDSEGTLLQVDSMGDAVEIDELLDDDENRDQLREMAASTEEIESKLSIKITIKDVLTAELQDQLTALLELFDTVVVFDELEVEIKIKIEEAGELPGDEATEEILEAREEVEKATEKIAKREEQGKDVTSAEALLLDAEALLVSAEEAFTVGDFDLAEDLAEESRETAKDSRMGRESRSVNSGSDGDLDEEDGGEDMGDDETVTDENDDTSLDPEDEEDSQDTDDSEDVDDDSESDDTSSGTVSDDDASSGSDDSSSSESDSNTDGTTSSDGTDSTGGSDGTTV